MALEPIDIAFRGADAAAASAPVDLKPWGPTGEASEEDVNRFRIAMGDLGEAKPADRLWGMVEDWNASVREKVANLSDTVGKGMNELTTQELLGLIVKSHEITMAQSLMAKVGASVNDTSNALLRGQ